MYGPNMKTEQEIKDEIALLKQEFTLNEQVISTIGPSSALIRLRNYFEGRIESLELLLEVEK